ncbi:MAG TPA: hypothetical protein ENJ09_13460, partial [Planctomycetes bacterium]|nr:hypothetical protein [Planctomycetota bacterium]
MLPRSRTVLSRSFLAVLLASPLAASVPVRVEFPPELLQDSLEAFHADVIGAFEDLAAWCQSKKLYLQRDLVYTDLLRIDPDNRAAR